MFKHARILQNANPNEGGGGGGGGATPWFGDTNKAYVEGKGWKTGDDAITSYRNLETLVGAEKAGRTVLMPKDDKDADGIKAFRSKLGVPEKADGYKVPDSLKDDPLLPAITAAAHKHGIPSSAYDGFVGDVLAALKEYDTKAATDATAASEKALGEIKAKHGDQYNAKVELGRRVVQALGVKAEVLNKIEAAIGTSDMMSLFIDLGAKLGESGAAGDDGKGGGNAGNLTAQQAQEKINELRGKRLKNEISQEKYLEELDRLGPIAEGTRTQ